MRASPARDRLFVRACVSALRLRLRLHLQECVEGSDGYPFICVRPFDIGTGPDWGSPLPTSAPGLTGLG